MAQRVLIVDDEAPLVNLLAQALSDHRFQVASARDGVDCMNKVATFKPDVVVMDVMMPRLDGVDATRLIRRNRSWSDVIIIALSARSDPASRDQIIQAGADLFVSKPFSIQRLIGQIQRLLVARARPAG